MRPKACILASIACLAPLGAAAQEIGCLPSQTLFECWTALSDPTGELAGRSTGEAVGAKGTELTKRAAQERAATAETPDSPSALTDLLPLLFSGLGLSDFTEGFNQAEDSYSFDRVFVLGNTRLDLGAKVFRDVELFEPLVAALPEAIRAAESARLSEDVGDLDKADVKLLVTWEKSRGDHRFGRDPDDYDAVTEEWFDELHDRVLGEIGAGTVSFGQWLTRGPGRSADAEYARLRGADDPEDLQQATIERIGTVLGAQAAAALEEDLVTTAQADSALLARIAAPMKTLADQVSDLITNQPQLLVEGVYREREHFTGPGEWSARLRFEIGLSGNFNDFVTWAAKQDAGGNADCRRTRVEEPVYPLRCLEEYLRTESAAGVPEEKAKNRGHRLTLAAQYTDTDPLHLVLPEHDFVYDLERSQKWTASLTYGAYFQRFQLPNLLATSTAAGVLAGPEDTARFDLEAKYDDATGDPARQSRFVATATVSQKMTDNSVLSFSAVYADEPEYLGEVDEEVTARFGLKWQLDRPTSP